VFYGWWDWRFVFLLAGSTVVNHVLAVAMHRARALAARKTLLARATSPSISAPLRTSSTRTSSRASADTARGRRGIAPSCRAIPRRHLVLHVPWRLSYVDGRPTAATSSPTALREVRRLPGVLPARRRRADRAGERVRAAAATPRDPRRVDASRAFFLIVVGLFLKVVIANHLATHIVDDVFAAPNRHSSLEVLVGVYGYAVQIFADFCGYTNIAIGVALLLGFQFPQNFDARTRRCRCRTSGAAGT
jgi:hypothetical protein